MNRLISSSHFTRPSRWGGRRDLSRRYEIFLHPVLIAPIPPPHSWPRGKPRRTRWSSERPAALCVSSRRWLPSRKGSNEHPFHLKKPVDDPLYHGCDRNLRACNARGRHRAMLQLVRANRDFQCICFCGFSSFCACVCSHYCCVPVVVEPLSMVKRSPAPDVSAERVVTCCHQPAVFDGLAVLLRGFSARLLIFPGPSASTRQCAFSCRSAGSSGRGGRRDKSRRYECGGEGR